MFVGLSGYARAGKDTAAKRMVDQHAFSSFAFADKMREIALAIDPIVDWYTTTPGGGRPVRYSEVLQAVGYDRAKANCPEVRVFLQRLGTEAGRNIIGQDFWVGLAMGNRSERRNWVITDVRFKNEAQSIVDRGGLVVRVERAGIEAANAHLSEHDLADWSFDSVIHNDGTIDDLNLAVDLFVQNEVVE